uniref:Adenomatous polyposis coli HduAPC n=1 Tax=Halisarca dujardinii TaxID=2583056 RepID=A0A8F8FJ36_HALDU|nr:Adenomatous polyposis coli HduAPC [Halisarca dujardinii]WEL12752.1 adenomatosis polyposis coli protein [Halisarca dujardinii]
MMAFEHWQPQRQYYSDMMAPGSGMPQEAGLSQSEHSSFYSEGGSSHCLLPGSGHHPYPSSGPHSPGQDCGRIYGGQYSSDVLPPPRKGSDEQIHPRDMHRESSVASTELSDPTSSSHLGTRRPSILLPAHGTLQRSVSMEDTSEKAAKVFPEVVKSSFERHDGLHLPPSGPYPPSNESPSSSEAGSYSSSVRRRLGSGPASEVSSFSRSTHSTHSSSSSRSALRGPHVPQPNYNSGPGWFPREHHPHDRPVPRSSRNAAHHHHGNSSSTGREMIRSRSAAPPRNWQPHPLPIHREYPRLEEEGSDVHYDHLHRATAALHSRNRSKSCEATDKHHKRGEGMGQNQGLDTVFLLLSLLTSKEQPDEQSIEVLEKLSGTEAMCQGMRQSGCMNLLLSIVHNWERKEEEAHVEVRQRAQVVLRRLVESQPDPDQLKYERNVLVYLERVRDHTDGLFELLSCLKASIEIEQEDLMQCKQYCEERIEYSLKKINTKSYDKQDYRPAILSLGGIQAVAEILVVNYKLAKFYSTHSSRIVILHPDSVISFVLNILVNLTYGDSKSKSTLCQIPHFLSSLIYHTRRGNESVIASAAQILRNLSWRASNDVKVVMADSDAANALCESIEKVHKDISLQHITSALWNLSAHSLDIREQMCTNSNTIPSLVKLLGYTSSDDATSLMVVENAGGILRNLSALISSKETYRQRLRDCGCLKKLLVHLKLEQSRMTLENACGILWNLSTLCKEDQQAMWKLGMPQQLLKLKDSEHKNVKEYSGRALKNLVQYSQGSMTGSKSDVVQKSSSSSGTYLTKTKSHAGTVTESADQGKKNRLGMSRARSLHSEVQQQQQRQRHTKNSPSSRQDKVVVVMESERVSPDGRHEGLTTNTPPKSALNKKDKGKKDSGISRKFQRIASAPNQSDNNFTPPKTKGSHGSRDTSGHAGPPQQSKYSSSSEGQEEVFVSTAGEEEPPLLQPKDQDKAESDEEEETGPKSSHYYVNLPPAPPPKDGKLVATANQSSSPAKGSPQVGLLQSGDEATMSLESPKSDSSRSSGKEGSSRKRRFLGFSRNKDKITDL